MSKKFTGLHAKNYLFRDGENTRNVIVIYAGDKRAGFIEYNVSRQFVDAIHDLTDAHERRQREEGSQ